MGATSVLMASELELPDNVFGIAADSAFTFAPCNLETCLRKQSAYSFMLCIKQVPIGCKKRIQMDADAASTTEALKHCQIPVLFVHGTDDHFVPVEMTYENYKACTSEKRLLIVPGADHCMSYLVGKSTYERIAKRVLGNFANSGKKNP